MKSNDNAIIVIPVYKFPLTSNEEISFRQCLNIFEDRIVTIITHKGILEISKSYFKGCRVITLNKIHFGSIDSYNSLMLSASFYKLFLNYDYILIYQLDCFVFKDELSLWIKKSYSYIGAPWFKGFGKPFLEEQLFGVGNGGFSLRNVKDFYNLLSSDQYYYYKVKINLFLNYTIFLNKKVKFKNLYVNPPKNEDYLFFEMSALTSEFSTPEPHEAVGFSFEVLPRKLFELNNKKLPFGCHAWYKYDLEFFKPFIESFGHEVCDLNEK